MRRAVFSRVSSFGPLLPVMLGLLASCGGGAEPDPAPPVPDASGSAVLAERAKVLDDAGLRALSSVESEGEGTLLVFSATSPVLETLSPGDVLIVGTSERTPRGALYGIETVAEMGDGLRVVARTATVDEAFESLAIALETTLAEAASVNPVAGSVGAVRHALGITFPFSFQAGSGANRAELNGSLAIDADVGLKLEFHVARFALEELSLSFEAQETLLAEFVGEGQQTFKRAQDLGSIGFTPITVYVPIPTPPGVVPVVLTPQITLEVGVQGSIQGRAEASVLQQASFTAGLGYRDGSFGGFSSDTSRFEAEPPAFEAGANVRVFGGPRLEVKIYGALGPYAGVEAFAELAASGESPPPCARGVLDAGLRARVGMDFLTSFESTLFDKRYPLAKFDSCTSDPNAPRPAITWARSFGRVGSPGEQARAVVAAADGTYLVVGDSGLFEGITGFAASLWAMRLDALGNVIWQRAFQRLDQGLVRGAVEVPDGFVIAGTSGLFKIDPGGNVVWARAFDGDHGVEVASMAADANGRFVVAGHLLDGGTQAWAAALDARGQVAWSRRYAIDAFTRIRRTTDGGFIAAGLGTDGRLTAEVLKLRADGTIAWARTLNNQFDASGGAPGMLMLATSNDRAFDAAETPSGGFLIAGESYGNFPIPEPGPAGYYATWIAALDAQGGLVSSTLHRSPDDANYGGAYAIGMRATGEPIVIGRRADQSSDLLTNEDVLVIQGRTYSVLGGAGNDAVDTGTLSGNSRGMPLQITLDGGAILAATSTSFGGKDEFWLVKLNRTGGINSPYRTSLPGGSYDNTRATSVGRDPDVSEAPLSTRAFDLPLRSEVTEVVARLQGL